MCSEPPTEMSFLPVFMVHFTFETMFCTYTALSFTLLR